MTLATGLALTAAGNARADLGPIGTYYLTSADGTSLSAIRGSSFHLNDNYSPNEGPIAVFSGPNVVRTTGSTITYSGGEYSGVDSLTVTKDGTTFTNGLPRGSFFFDGTTNGVNNFTVDFGNNGAVIATDTHWGGSGTVLFYTGNNSDYGITYDKWNNSLWIQNYGTGIITDYTMTGTILSSFGDSDGGAKTALAMDVDRTLWFQALTTGAFEHYNVNGDFLGSVSYSGLGYAHGGEIVQDLRSVPEPSAFLSAATGGLIILGAVVRRRQRV